MDNSEKKRISQREILRVNWLGVVINVLLTVLKFTFGLMVGSMSLVADGVHSLSDLVTDFAVVLGMKMASKWPDAKHPYGHEWYESLAGVFISAVLIIVGGGMIHKAGHSIANGDVTKFESCVLVIASISIFMKEYLYRITRNVAKKTHSASLYANAWHHRSDAFSSVAVLLGAVSAAFGFEYGDQFATAAVGLMIILAGAKGIERAIREFSDAAVDDETIEQIKEIINSHEEIRDWHKLRTRTVGREVFLDFHILVDPFLNVVTAHNISEEVEKDLHEKINRPVNIIIHIEPEESER